MAEAPVTIQRQQDGRHAVMDASGAVLGLHNSPWSAARQMHDYFNAVEPGDVEPAREEMEAKRVGGKQGAIMERPQIPKPPKGRPRIPAARIPKP